MAEFGDKVIADLDARRAANVPGIEELKSAENKAGGDYDRRMANETPDAASGGSLAKKFPRAYVWLRADHRLSSSDFWKLVLRHDPPMDLQPKSGAVSKMLRKRSG